MNSILRNVNQIPAIFTFKLNLNKEYQPLIYDLIRMAIIHTMINILSHAANPYEIELFGSNYFTILFFILIGVATYWLIVNKVIRFEFTDNDMCESENNEEESEDKNTVETLVDSTEENSANNVVPNDAELINNASCE